MKFFTQLCLAAMASVVSSASVNLNKRDSPLDVKLEMVGNSEVKATVTNTGASDLNLFKSGTFMDNAPVEKVEVYSAESRVAFDGVRLRTTTTNLSSEVFTNIPAGQTIEVTFDIATMHDLTTGGAFDILAQGAIPYAEADSTELTGAVSFVSNKLTATVDAAQASKVRRAFLDSTKKIKARSVLQSDCTGTYGTGTRTAMTNCVSLANAASSAAVSGSSSKFSEYFKTTSSSTRSAVASTFKKVATECGSTTSGNADYYCITDSYGYCESNVLAYTIPSLALIVNCPLYYSDLPALSSTCHAQDRATTTLHEMTHLTSVKGTDDLGYGYSAASRLSASQALNNADTYALYANAIYVGC